MPCQETVGIESCLLGDDDDDDDDDKTQKRTKIWPRLLDYTHGNVPHGRTLVRTASPVLWLSPPDRPGGSCRYIRIRDLSFACLNRYYAGLASGLSQINATFLPGIVPCAPLPRRYRIAPWNRETVAETGRIPFFKPGRTRVLDRNWPKSSCKSSFLCGAMVFSWTTYFYHTVDIVTKTSSFFRLMI
jgi:hypothetical protein